MEEFSDFSLLLDKSETHYTRNLAFATDMILFCRQAGVAPKHGSDVRGQSDRLSARELRE